MGGAGYDGQGVGAECEQDETYPEEVVDYSDSYQQEQGELGEIEGKQQVDKGGIEDGEVIGDVGGEHVGGGSSMGLTGVVEETATGLNNINCGQEKDGQEKVGNKQYNNDSNGLAGHVGIVGEGECGNGKAGMGSKEGDTGKGEGEIVRAGIGRIEEEDVANDRQDIWQPVVVSQEHNKGVEDYNREADIHYREFGVGYGAGAGTALHEQVNHEHDVDEQVYHDGGREGVGGQVRQGESNVDAMLRNTYNGILSGLGEDGELEGKVDKVGGSGNGEGGNGENGGPENQQTPKHQLNQHLALKPHSVSSQPIRLQNEPVNSENPQNPGTYHTQLPDQNQEQTMSADAYERDLDELAAMFSRPESPSMPGPTVVDTDNDVALVGVSNVASSSRQVENTGNTPATQAQIPPSSHPWAGGGSPKGKQPMRGDMSGGGMAFNDDLIEYSDDGAQDGDDYDYLQFKQCSVCDDGGHLVMCDGLCGRCFHVGLPEHFSSEEIEEHTEALVQEDIATRTALAKQKVDINSSADVKNYCNAMDIPLDLYFHIVKQEHLLLCPSCTYDVFMCAICQKEGNRDNDEIMMCSIQGCGTAFHPKCLNKILNKIQKRDVAAGEGSSAQAQQGQHDEAFGRECPYHVCHSCGEPDQGEGGPKGALFPCKRCPRAYHFNCIPAMYRSINDRVWPSFPLKGFEPECNTNLMYCKRHTPHPSTGVYKPTMMQWSQQLLDQWKTEQARRYPNLASSKLAFSVAKEREEEAKKRKRGMESRSQGVVRASREWSYDGVDGGDASDGSEWSAGEEEEEEGAAEDWGSSDDNDSFGDVVNNQRQLEVAKREARSEHEEVREELAYGWGGVKKRQYVEEGRGGGIGVKDRREGKGGGVVEQQKNPVQEKSAVEAGRTRVVEGGYFDSVQKRPSSTKILDSADITDTRESQRARVSLKRLEHKKEKQRKVLKSIGVKVGGGVPSKGKVTWAPDVTSRGVGYSIESDDGSSVEAGGALKKRIISESKAREWPSGHPVQAARDAFQRVDQGVQRSSLFRRYNERVRQWRDAQLDRVVQAASAYQDRANEYKQDAMASMRFVQNYSKYRGGGGGYGEGVSLMKGLLNSIRGIESKIQLLQKQVREGQAGGGGYDEQKRLFVEQMGYSNIKRISKDIGRFETLIAPLRHLDRYTSYGRHFTNVDGLWFVAQKLGQYIKEGDTIIDFSCGTNEWVHVMKQYVQTKHKKHVNIVGYDVITSKEQQQFVKQDWLTVRPSDSTGQYVWPHGVQHGPQPGSLISSKKLVIGLNPPFGKHATLASRFVLHAAKFKPRLIVLIAPKITQVPVGYAIFFTDEKKFSERSFYVPGTEHSSWNNDAPALIMMVRQ